MRFLRRGILLLALGFGCASPPSGESSYTPAPGHWPQWRGPKRDNVSAEIGLLKEWPEGGPKLLWKTTGLGESMAPVSVAGGLIFTLGYREDKEFVTAFHEELNRETRSREAALGQRRRDLAQVQHKLDGLIDAIAGGLRSASLQEKLGKLEAQKAANAQAQLANERLASEVRDLKEGLEMVEEKARFELGMLKPDEILVQLSTAKR